MKTVAIALLVSATTFGIAGGQLFEIDTARLLMIIGV